MALYCRRIFWLLFVVMHSCLCFFSMGLAVTSVFYQLVFVHIIALCDTVKLHANTSSNKTSSLFLSGLVMTTVCRRNFSVPYLIPASTSLTFFGSRVHFSANFIAHCCWLIYIFIFFHSYVIYDFNSGLFFNFHTTSSVLIFIAFSKSIRHAYLFIYIINLKSYMCERVCFNLSKRKKHEIEFEYRCCCHTHIYRLCA